MSDAQSTAIPASDHQQLANDVGDWFQKEYPVNPRWALAAVVHRNTHNKPMSFARRPWAPPIYRDRSRTIVIQKSVQIGISDLMLVDLMVNAMAKRSVMYVLPRNVDVWEFTPRRIFKLISRVSLYQQGYRKTRKDSDTKTQITMFGADIHIVGSNSEENFHEKPVDTLIVDEMDKCDQHNLVVAEDRLEAADNPWIRRIGNPTVPGRRISQEYKASDQKVWMISCQSCGKHQELDWFDNVVLQRDDGTWVLRSDLLGYTEFGKGDASAICRYCEKPVNRLAQGEWVAAYPDREVSGYRCSSIFAKATMTNVIRELFATFVRAQMEGQTVIQEFWNKRLGLPYRAEGSFVDEGMLERCAVAGYMMPNNAENAIAGIDVGKVCHLHISIAQNGCRRKVFIGTVPLELDDIIFTLKQYGVRMGVVDALPESKFAKDLCQAYPGMYRCYYASQSAGDKKSQLQIDHPDQSVKVDRTETLDRSFQELHDKRVELPQDWRAIDQGRFVRQMMAPVRVLDESGKEPRYVWDEGNDPDHHRHADNYECIAYRIYQGGADALWVM